MRDPQLYWCLTEAQEAFRKGQPQLASRYVEKALERVWCMYCHRELDDSEPYRPHFKGFVHEACAESYHGRGDYLRQHPEER